MEGAVAVVAVVERRLRPTPISGAIVFTAVGLLASEQGTGLIGPSSHGHGAAAFLELTLVSVLFTDAMAVSGARWATEAPLPARLLGLGLPLTMVAGWVLALALLPDAGLWGTALAFVTIFLALALEEEGAVGGGHIAQVLLRSLVASGAIGVVVGAGARWCCAGRRARVGRHGTGSRWRCWPWPPSPSCWPTPSRAAASSPPGWPGWPPAWPHGAAWPQPSRPRRVGQPGHLGQLRVVRGAVPGSGAGRGALVDGRLCAGEPDRGPGGPGCDRAARLEAVPPDRGLHRLVRAPWAGLDRLRRPGGQPADCPSRA